MYKIIKLKIREDFKRSISVSVVKCDDTGFTLNPLGQISFSQDWNRKIREKKEFSGWKVG